VEAESLEEGKTTQEDGVQDRLKRELEGERRREGMLTEGRRERTEETEQGAGEAQRTEG